MTDDWKEGWDDFCIEDSFCNLLPPLSDEEFVLLRGSIVAEGVRDPLIVWDRSPEALVEAGFGWCKDCERDVPIDEWKQDDDVYCCRCGFGLGPISPDILLDGHNRARICAENEINEFEIVKKRFDDEVDAENWVDFNQCGRRNVTADYRRFLMGRVYNRRKKRQGDRGPQKSAQSAHSNRTCEKVAAEYGVDPATVRRAGKFAEEIDANPKLMQAIRDRVPVSKVVTEIKRDAIIEQLETVAAAEAPEIRTEYDVIVIDPPWSMEKIERDCRPNQTAFDYPTMDEDELSDLHVPYAKDCHVWLWATHKHLPMAMRLLGDWGLKYVCAFVWHKPGGFQPHNLPQYNCEFALYARKGTPAFIDTKAFNVCFDAPRGKHSEKPEGFYDVLRRVTGGRRLDMFNRRRIDGFDGWGKEVAA